MLHRDYLILVQKGLDTVKPVLRKLLALYTAFLNYPTIYSADLPKSVKVTDYKKLTAHLRPQRPREKIPCKRTT